MRSDSSQSANSSWLAAWSRSSWLRSKLVVPLTSVRRPLDDLDVGLLADVLGAFKHHVLEEWAKPVRPAAR